jgi:hypothetical protein
MGRGDESGRPVSSSRAGVKKNKLADRRGPPARPLKMKRYRGFFLARLVGSEGEDWEEGGARGGSPERRRPAARVQGGGGGPPRPPWSGRRSGRASVRRERTVVCGDVVVGELDLGHGREGNVV